MPTVNMCQTRFSLIGKILNSLFLLMVSFDHLQDCRLHDYRMGTRMKTSSRPMGSGQSKQYPVGTAPYPQHPVRNGQQPSYDSMFIIR